MCSGKNEADLRSSQTGGEWWVAGGGRVCRGKNGAGLRLQTGGEWWVAGGGWRERVPWEKRSRTALANGWRVVGGGWAGGFAVGKTEPDCACKRVAGGFAVGKTEPDCAFNGGPVARMKSSRILSCAERGTSLDHGEGEFSPARPREHGAGLVTLSSLFLSISVLLQGVPASHRTGFKTASKMRLFLGSGVSFQSYRSNWPTAGLRGRHCALAAMSVRQCDSPCGRMPAAGEPKTQLQDRTEAFTVYADIVGLETGIVGCQFSGFCVF